MLTYIFRLAGLLALALFLVFVGFLALAGGLFEPTNEKRLQVPAVYEPAARDLALLSQSSSLFAGADFLTKFGQSWLPPSLRSLDLSDLHFIGIQPDHVALEFGGGFHHWGYALDRDAAASKATSSVWHLTMGSEDRPSKLLFTFSTDPKVVLNKATWVNGAIHEYNRVNAANPTRRGFQEEIQFLLFFASAASARKACAEAKTALPGDWWANLTAALALAADGKSNDADRQIQAWADAKPSYSRYIIQAFNAKHRSQPASAVTAVEKAVGCPIVDLPDDNFNTEARGYNIGVYLYSTGQYATVLKLVAALEPVRANGRYAKSALAGLKSAATAALTTPTPATYVPDPSILDVDPYKDFDLPKLLGP